MKPVNKLLLALLSTLLSASAAQAQAQNERSAPQWMGVDSLTDATYLRPAVRVDATPAGRAFATMPTTSDDATGSFRMLSRQGGGTSLAGQSPAQGASFEASPAPVPELRNYALILASLGVVGFMARRRSGR